MSARFFPASVNGGSFGGVAAFSAWRLRMTVTWHVAESEPAKIASQRIRQNRRVVRFMITAGRGSWRNLDLPLLVCRQLARQAPRGAELKDPPRHCILDFALTCLGKLKLFS